MTDKTIYSLFDGKTLKLIERALIGSGITSQEKASLRICRATSRGVDVKLKQEWIDLALLTNSVLESIEGYYSFNFSTNRYTIHLPTNVPILEDHIKRIMNKFPYPYDIENTPAIPDKVEYLIVPITGLQRYQLHDIASSRGMKTEDYLQTLIVDHINVEVGANDVSTIGEKNEW